MRLKIHKKGPPQSPYVVHLPRRANAGRQARRYFSTRAAALDFVNDQAAKDAEMGAGLWAGLTQAEIAELARHAHRLREQRGKEPMTARVALERFYKAQMTAKASKPYLAQIRHQGQKFISQFGDRALADIGRDEIPAWLNSMKGISPTSRFATFRVASAIFGYAVEMGWLAANPCAKLAKRLPRPIKPKGILRPDELRRLLAAADDRIMLPSVALGAFAGLRPCEIERLHWEDIKWDQGQIFVRPEVVKQTKRERSEGHFVTINDGLRAWLLPASKQTGPVIPVKDAAVKRAKKATCESAGVTIPHDGLRHSFATYHYALHNDAALTAREMKHSTTDITFRHYARRDVTKKDAEAWFGVRPPKRARNVVPMRGAG